MSSIDSNVAIPVHTSTMIPTVVQEKREAARERGEDGGNGSERSDWAMAAILVPEGAAGPLRDGGRRRRQGARGVRRARQSER